MGNKLNEYAYQELLKWLPKAKTVTQKRLKDRHMGAESVTAQLGFIEGFVKDRRTPTDEEVDRIILYQFANKELDPNDPEWSDVITQVAYQFGNLGHPELEEFHEGPWRRLQVNLPKASEMTQACLRLHPYHSLFLGVIDELKFIEQVHRQHRKPTHEERIFPIRNICSVDSNEPARSMKTYRAMMDAIYIDWEALCEAPKSSFDPDQDGSLYPDIKGL